MYHDSVTAVKHALRKIPSHVEVRLDEPLAKHTTIEVGGPADAFIIPESPDETAAVVQALHGEPFFILGGGANIVVADAGIRGVVVSMERLNALEIAGDTVAVGSGRSVSDTAWELGSQGIGAIHFLYGMPGSVGGALWMNARCYGSEVSDVLLGAVLLDRNGSVRSYRTDPADFAYKRSPFQDGRHIILSAEFTATRGEAESIVRDMVSFHADREHKGHFSAPSAGSMFKNNRDFGVPTGKIIDEAGLRGTQVGGAKVSDLHGNIFINSGGATATDFRRLVEMVRSEVRRKTGFELELEVLFVGDWESEEIDAE